MGPGTEGGLKWFFLNSWNAKGNTKDLKAVLKDYDKRLKNIRDFWREWFRNITFQRIFTKGCHKSEREGPLKEYKKARQEENENGRKWKKWKGMKGSKWYKRI